MACQVVSAGAAVVIQNKIKGHYRQGSKEQGPINRAILLVKTFFIGIKAFRQWSKTKTNQIVIQLTWHCFGGKTNWLGQKKELKGGELMVWRTK